MSADVFFDANVLLYVVSPDKQKADRAEALLKAGGTISVQTLNEMANVGVKKFRMPLYAVKGMLEVVRMTCAVRPLDVQTHERGIELLERFRYGVHDSMVLAAALGAGCSTLYSEDMQHGQRIESLTIRNPFRK